MSNTLLPYGLQHARPPCPSPTPGIYSNSCPLSWWCHSTISSSVFPFSSCLQSFPPSESFSVSQLFTSGSQSIGSVTRVCVPLFFVLSQQRFGVTDIKAPSACHSSQVMDRPCYSFQVLNGPWASQECCLFHLRFSLQSSDLPLFYFHRLFPFFVF